MKSIQKVISFATIAHKGQKRKHTFEPYVEHPVAVLEILTEHVKVVTPEAAAAAILHDVVEDTRYTLADIKYHFGNTVAEYVDFLTKPYSPQHFNRAARKADYRKKIYHAPPIVKSIKLADILHNAPSIIEYDPEFARVWIEEIWLLLYVLRKGNIGNMVMSHKVIKVIKIMKDFEKSQGVKYDRN